MPERIPASLLAVLTDLVEWLDSAHAPAMVIGGVAASLLGRPRLTQDIDALVLLPESGWPDLLAAADRHGIVPRIADALGFARRSRMLLLTHSASAIDIDVSLGGLAFEEQAVARSQIHEVGGIKMQLPRVEDLLVMKAFAHRPKDMDDIDGLLNAHPNADLEFVRKWLREFSAALSRPDLLEDFEKTVARRHAKP